MQRGHITVGLHSPKSVHNIGSVMRAMGCYGGDLVMISGRRFSHGDVMWAPTDTRKDWRHIPALMVNDLFDSMPVGATPIAVDLVDDAIPLPQFAHPERAYYVFGPEDGTLGAKTLDRCQFKVMVPTRRCMNLAATVNVVLYDRMVKRDKDLRRGA